MGATHSAKLRFANGARRFANGPSPRLRRALLAVAAALVVSVAGPFGTGALPAAPRTAFWLSECLFIFAQWELWFVWWLRRGWHWRRTLLLGLPAMLLPLPFEVDLGLRIFAGVPAGDHAQIWLQGAAIAALWALTMLLLYRRDGAPAVPPDARFEGTAIRLERIAAIIAEDHYVRLCLADGGEHLVYRRFADAVEAMDGVPGEILRRGVWLADAHRGAARCRDRRWYIRAAGERWLPVSRSRLGELRRKGWLVREG